MKKLNPLSFKLILAGLLTAFVTEIIVYFLTDYEALFKNLGIAEEMKELMITIYKTTFIVVIIFSVIFYGYFIMRLFKNIKEPQGQGYITFIYVLYIISTFFNVISLISAFTASAIINLAIQVVVIYGCVIQRKYVEPVEDDDEIDTNSFFEQ